MFVTSLYFNMHLTSHSLYSAIIAVVGPPDDPPTFEQRYSLMCSVTGAVSINPTINYQWFKTAPRRIEVGTNSPILTFDTLVLSDAGQYSCEVTVSSSLLSQAATVGSRDYNLRFPSKSVVESLMQHCLSFIRIILIIPIIIISTLIFFVRPSETEMGVVLFKTAATLASASSTLREVCHCEHLLSQ